MKIRSILDLINSITLQWSFYILNFIVLFYKAFVLGHLISNHRTFLLEPCESAHIPFHRKSALMSTSIDFFSVSGDWGFLSRFLSSSFNAILLIMDEVNTIRIVIGTWRWCPWTQLVRICTIVRWSSRDECVSISQQIIHKRSDNIAVNK